MMKDTKSGTFLGILSLVRCRFMVEILQKLLGIWDQLLVDSELFE